jgi:hypothetical protein
MGDDAISALRQGLQFAWVYAMVDGQRLAFPGFHSLLLLSFHPFFFADIITKPSNAPR